MTENKKEEMKAKWAGFKVRVEAKVREGIEWCRNNREEATFLATTGIAVLSTVVKTAKYADRKLEQKREKELHEKDVYDRSLGLYHHLKHRLTPSEIKEIDRRKANGESLAVILNDMNLVK